MDFNVQSNMVVITGKGLSEFAAEELKGMGYEISEIKQTNVHTKGTMLDAMKINLNSRYGLYVLYLVKKFKADNPDKLYKQINSIDWENIISPDEYISIDSKVETASINNTMYPNLRAKDAIVDRIMQKTGKRPDSGSEKENVVINLYWNKDDCWIYLNTSGRKLSDRNYRKMPHRAPLQECLAAAVIKQSGYDGSCPLVLPMCGSGTLAIEAVWSALNRPAGGLRSNFGFMHIKGFDREQWETIRREAKKNVLKKTLKPIIATDIDPKAVAAAKQNAMTAGVDQLIDFAVCDFRKTKLPQEKGIILMNPEYGQRLGDENKLAVLYKEMGDYFKKSCAGWTGYIFTGNLRLAKAVGLRTSQRTIFFNAAIECRLLKYELYEGREK